LKKLKLDDYAAADFRGLAIVSPEKDYRLCFFINKELGIELEKSAQLNVFEPDKNKRTSVLCYIHKDIENGSRYFLAKNRQDNLLMIPEMKQVDYFFLEPENQKNTIDQVKKLLINISSIQGCFNIPVQNLKYIDAE
jgi:hypothetical protein